MKSIAVCIALIFCFAITYALDCPSCDITKCKPYGNCPAGIVKDVCGCCKVCAKHVGEECGGPWNVFGECGINLVCIKPLPPPEEKDHVTWYFNKKGHCAGILS